MPASINPQHLFESLQVLSASNQLRLGADSINPGENAITAPYTPLMAAYAPETAPNFEPTVRMTFD